MAKKADPPGGRLKSLPDTLATHRGFADVIELLRTFDTVSQRSVRGLETVGSGHERAIRAFAFGRTRDFLTTDDVVQETFLTGTAKATQFTPDDHLQAVLACLEKPPRGLGRSCRCGTCLSSRRRRSRGSSIGSVEGRVPSHWLGRAAGLLLAALVLVGIGGDLGSLVTSRAVVAGINVIAFQGSVADAPRLWRPKWSVAIALPESTDFVLLHCYTGDDKGDSVAVFDGQFVDDVRLGVMVDSVQGNPFRRGGNK